MREQDRWQRSNGVFPRADSSGSGERGRGDRDVRPTASRWAAGTKRCSSRCSRRRCYEPSEVIGRPRWRGSSRRGSSARRGWSRYMSWRHDCGSAGRVSHVLPVRLPRAGSAGAAGPVVRLAVDIRMGVAVRVLDQRLLDRRRPRSSWRLSAPSCDAEPARRLPTKHREEPRLLRPIGCATGPFPFHRWTSGKADIAGQLT